MFIHRQTNCAQKRRLRKSLWLEQYSYLLKSWIGIRATLKLFFPDWILYLRSCTIIIGYTICILLLCRQINLSLSSISPLLAGKINRLLLCRIFFTCTHRKLLTNSLTSPHSSLRNLHLHNCTFSRGVYNRLIAAITTSKLPHHCYRSPCCL